MSIHKLTAGSGYDYLTRQVAALDATEKGHVGLASYYTERGETPGMWIGAGLAGVDGLRAGDVVTAGQMQALFGAGLHPLARLRQEQLQGPDLTVGDYQAVARLGVPFKVYAHDVPPFRVEVARRVAGLNSAAGLPGDWPVPAADRARIRTEVAREFFAAEHGRPPADARELAGTIARLSRPQTRAVAGYDLTFSPVKSVSALWALADPPVAARIEQAHQAAVRDALAFLETHALFTRTGTGGVRQVEVTGMVAAGFTHRDSRAGDPDLHTHVAVANKVQTRDGRWLSIDGRVLFTATVAASETYNTALEHHLHAGLGLRFTERPNPDPRKRPVREVIGVHPELLTRWSARRLSIEARHSELAAQFQAAHGRPPTPVESLRLAQQATLETRDAKHEPRTLAEQRATWRAQAGQVLGGHRAVQRMLHAALSPTSTPRPPTDPAWLAETASRVLAAVEQRRSTWQGWHVRAEAHRQLRAAGLAGGGNVEELVDRLVEEVLHRRSVPLTGPADGILEPAVLRRSDGASVYSVAGAGLFTSRRVLAAEQRLVAAGGRLDGRTVAPEVVELALLEATANGVTLNAGQAALVRAMATSGARLQLAIAPAGAGKTTAMRVLAAAWTEDGGTVIGLAPSAAAAAALRDQTGAATDTLAKLTWSLDHADLPGWAQTVGPKTLVVIDEAGMADTVSLDRAVAFVTGRGGSVRLVGDDQQLAAVGAGGVLRDLQTTHGAVRLTELLRFTDPAEAAATLALRDGQPEALGFYLDHHRVHVGDLATLTENLFTAWQHDRTRGLDALMLAPTRDLAAELNRRARTHRLTNHPQPHADAPATVLADGNEASAGDLVITRRNQRTLRLSATDWVTNGDRWTIRAVHPGGDLTVQHRRHGLVLRLPAGYVRESVELGYATTVHTAQGVTADTTHGLVDGQQSRQQLYTMLTRGRAANHLYLQVVGDGDPHSVIRPDTVHPRTPTDLLEQILTRDDTPRSATTLRRDQHDPRLRLGHATTRYRDALHLAAEQTAGPEAVQALETLADQVLPGLPAEPAWPTLRAHLLLLAVAGADPAAELRAAAASRELHSADDRAAVLDWRLNHTGSRDPGPGPLPWLPGIPHGLRDHPTWGPYLTARAHLVASLAQQVRSRTANAGPPDWALQAGITGPVGVLADVEMWRAAMQVSRDDRRPTGPAQPATAARTWQRRLDRKVFADPGSGAGHWDRLLCQVAPAVAHDSFASVLADRLSALTRTRADAGRLLAEAANAGPLPDDHAAAALWWRISRHLTPAVAAAADHAEPLAAPWVPRLAGLVGAHQAEDLQASPWWPPLITAVDNALQQGWRLEDLLHPADTTPDGSVDACQALMWRFSRLTDPPPDDPDEPVPDQPPADPRELPQPVCADTPLPAGHPDGNAGSTPDVAAGPADEDRWVEPDLAVAAMVRDVLGPPDPTDADIRRMADRAHAWQECPVSRERLLEVNQLSLEYFRARYPSSWGRPYLAGRFGQDITDDPRFLPGQAPAGWTNLVDHLRRHQVSDQEMTVAGVATVASTGRVIDRFRDRVVFPILHDGDILGFVARRHPDLTDQDRGGPKYLNTPDTPLFHKGAQLFGIVPHHLDDGAVPVVVEGPMDAVAVTLATGGRYLGVAPLGTSLTDEQAAQLARIGIDPIMATDPDLAGQVAAERHYWILTPHRLDPRHAALPDGTDPADLLATQGPAALTAVVDTAAPLGDRLLDERLTHLPPDRALLEATRVAAARPAPTWDQASSHISTQLQVPLTRVRRVLLSQVRAWNTDPRQAAQQPLHAVADVKERLAKRSSPGERWAGLAGDLDPRLPDQGDWPALAQLMQTVHDQGHDVASVTRALIEIRPLAALPAQDLRYRLAAHLHLDPPPTTAATTTAVPSTPRPESRARRPTAPVPRR